MHEPVATLNRKLNYLLAETDAAYHDLALKLGLADSTMMILYALIDAQGRCPLQSLYRGTGQSKQTISSALHKLEAGGFVSLMPADKKSKIVCLTDKGKVLAARTAGRVAALENEIYEAWPQEDLERYLVLTEKYLNDLRQKIKALEITSNDTVI